MPVAFLPFKIPLGGLVALATHTKLSQTGLYWKNSSQFEIEIYRNVYTFILCATFSAVRIKIRIYQFICLIHSQALE